LIHPQKGSLFFIGQILTSLDLGNAAEPVKDFCGTCDRCLRACPTQALIEPRKLDANKCIAYWTIEAPAPAPPELRAKFGDWFFGCDICQTVCPWNEKTHGRDLLRSLSAEQKPPALEDLRWILGSSNKSLEKAFRGSPISRARPRGLKRNALQLIGTLKIAELRTEAEAHLDDPHLGEIASWALAQLT
jgi:epoxyqueuosine reductase